MSLRVLARPGAADAAESSAAVRERVERARAVQRARFASLAGVACNAHVPGRWLDAHGGIEPAARDLLAAAAERLALTARGYHRVLKVARTIADLDGDVSVRPYCIAEAIRYRPAAGHALDRARETA